MQGHIRYDSSKGDVRPVLSTKRHYRAKGDAVEAIFFVTAILLPLTISLVMIVLVSGSALLVVLSQKIRSLKHFRASVCILLNPFASCSYRIIFDFTKSARNVWSNVVCIYSMYVRSCNVILSLTHYNLVSTLL